MSHISSIPSKMSSILRCTVILHTTKKKKVNSSTMTCHQLKNIPISEMLKYGEKNVHIKTSHPRALPRLAAYDGGQINLSVLQFPHL